MSTCQAVSVQPFRTTFEYGNNRWHYDIYFCRAHRKPFDILDGYGAFGGEVVRYFKADVEVDKNGKILK